MDSPRFQVAKPEAPKNQICAQLALKALLLITVASVFSTIAYAVPSYSRQTGLPCAACHYSPPELNAFGRKFKLEGYTFVTKSEITDNKKDHSAPLHLLEEFPISLLFDTSFTSTKAQQPGTQNGNFEFPQQASFFWAGRWADHVGSFVQVTYNGQADHFSWDNSDIRYADSDGHLFGKTLTFGSTLNNNPTVEDLWNTTPAWGFPFEASDTAPGPSAAAIINGSLAQDVAGAGGYAMWNDHWYLASTMYRSEHLGSSQPNTGTGATYNIRGLAPYWRGAYTTSWKNSEFEVGTYGMHMKSTPNAVTGLMDGYTDYAVDFQYDRVLPQWKNDVLSLRGTYIRENSFLTATFNEGGASVPGHRLNTAQIEAEYHFGTRFSATAGYFNITGTADALLFPEAQVSGNFNGSPASNGYILNASWWPQQNIELAAQYTGYGRFNGASTNYDAASRDANGNNSIFLLARFVF